MPVINRVADLQPDIMAWRRDLHAHPELMYEVTARLASSPIACAYSVVMKW